MYTSPLLYVWDYIHLNLQTDDLFLASDSEPAISVMSGFAGHIDSWLATARQEKIASLKGVNGYNPSRNTRETCNIEPIITWKGLSYVWKCWLAVASAQNIDIVKDV